VQALRALPLFLRLFLPLTLPVLLAGVAAAQDPAAVQAPEVQVRGRAETEAVRGAQPTSSLTGDTLRRSLSNTLGETVSEMAGTHNSSFGPGVGVPVIRGMSGPRIKIAVDGIGTHDASSMSPDHAITVEPMLAEEIRVLRGPETIRYGSGAIGGAVEVSDGRIARRRLDGPFAGSAEGRYGTNGREKSGAVKLKGGTGPLVFEVDGFFRERGNLGIPGKAVDEAAVAQQFGLTGIANSTHSVPNTDLRTHGGGAGLTYVGDRLLLGISTGSIENNYGIPPGGHAHNNTPLLDPTIIEGGNVRIDMQQTRHDYKLEWKPGRPWLNAVRARGGAVDYRHDEVDGTRIATSFLNRVNEYRLEADHRIGTRLSGTLGGHLIDRDFSALGIEVFVPRTAARTHAFHLSEKLDLGPLTFEAAWRDERQFMDPESIRRGNTVAVFPEMTYRARSAAASATLRLGPGTRLTGMWSRPERAPDIQELYSLGPHLATRSYNIGNRRLDVESMRRTDLGITHEWARGGVKLNAFRYEADGFIYLRNVGTFYDLDRLRILRTCVRLERCLPVLQYDQQDAVFNGYEGEFLLRFPDTRFGAFETTFFTDAVRARFVSAGQGDVPRIPPRRTGVEVTWFRDDDWTVRLRWTRAAAQANPGINETSTEGYDLVNFSLDKRFERSGAFSYTVFVHARNLLNEEIRNSASFLRSFSPEAGRRLEMGVRADF
jgi:iron complex outermembrane receptor protein